MGVKKEPEAKKTITKRPLLKRYPTLRLGSEGKDVEKVQKILQKSGSSVKVTGVFSIGTVSAVRAFQKKKLLPVTGVVDTDTWAALNKVK